jgi:acetyl-CoA carboxylase alpha subunit
MGAAVKAFTNTAAKLKKHVKKVFQELKEKAPNYSTRKRRRYQRFACSGFLSPFI